MMKVGYMTGTFDQFHQGHINALRNASRLCNRLIVGVTTDEVATKQKREPCWSFEHRLAVVESCRWVDVAVPHDGESKNAAKEKFNADVIFSSEEYEESPEFADVLDQTVFFPRTKGVSTSWLKEKSDLATLLSISVLGTGVGDTKLFGTPSWFVKAITVPPKDRYSTADHSGMGFPRPRNWKRKGAEAKHPNYPGVNRLREVRGAELTQGAPWSPVVAVQRKTWGEYWIVQRRAEVTLMEALQRKWMPKEDALDKVLAICADLRRREMVHGDIHPENLLVSEAGELLLVDFGWCLHGSFDMEPVEREIWQDRLRTDFDFTHFTESLECLGF